MYPSLYVTTMSIDQVDQEMIWEHTIVLWVYRNCQNCPRLEDDNLKTLLGYPIVVILFKNQVGRLSWGAELRGYLEVRG